MVVEMIPKYLFSKDKIKEYRQAVSLDEKGKELFIHDFIVENVKIAKCGCFECYAVIGNKTEYYRIYIERLFALLEGDRHLSKIRYYI